jgi:uncharacterized protein
MEETVMTSSSPTPDSEGVASLESLGRSECLNLLATAQVGRLALVVDGHPEILPVNYALDGDAVLFRTSEGSVLTHVALAEVAFEVDHVDEATRSGWSVLIKGHADDIGDAIDATSQRLRRLSLISWAPGRRDRWFVVRPRQITGRRLRVLPLEL